jgi:hypothetical protein
VSRCLDRLWLRRGLLGLLDRLSRLRDRSRGAGLGDRDRVSSRHGGRLWRDLDGGLLLRRVLDGSLLVLLILFHVLLKVAKDVVEHEVAIGLLGEEEGLRELSPWCALVRHLSDHQDDDTPVGGRLRVDRVDEDLTLVVADRVDSLVDFLPSARALIR